MALIILTENNPAEALGAVIRRLAFLLMPLSVLFIKFYPELGRTYHMGMPMYTGVTFQKNSLGALCLVIGMYFFWAVFFNDNKELKINSKHRTVVFIIIISMVIWLLYMSNSVTSQLCLVISIISYIIGVVPSIQKVPIRFIKFSAAVVIFLGLAQLLFNIEEIALNMFGRTPDLTNRVPIWNALLKMVEYPLIGYGYENFWAGERLLKVWEIAGARIITSHNGYLDLYLSIGAIGLTLFFICIIASIIKNIKHINSEYKLTILRISYILVVLIYNWSESSIKPFSLTISFLFFCIIELPGKNGRKLENKVTG